MCIITLTMDLHDMEAKVNGYLKCLKNIQQRGQMIWSIYPIQKLFSIDFHLFCQKERNKQKVESLFIKSIKTTRLEIIDKTVYIAEQILLPCRILNTKCTFDKYRMGYIHVPLFRVKEGHGSINENTLLWTT